MKEKTGWTDKAAGKIAGAGFRLQGKFASIMGKLFSKNIRTFLWVFCMSAGGYSFYLITGAIFNTGHQPVIKIEPVKVPKTAKTAGDEHLLADPYVDEQTYRQVQGFKFWMDSIRLHRRPLYDSIVTARPGLMDSITLLEQIYQQQGK